MTARAAIAALAGAGEIQTWSLIVTILGDMARAPGAAIPGPVLTALTGRIGIRPEAMRVALHRLRKDGWIETRKLGRVSHYALSAAGLAEAEAAAGRIYAEAPDRPGTWHLLVAGPTDAATRLNDDGALAADGLIALAAGVWLGKGAGRARQGFFMIEGTARQVPDWLGAHLLPPPLAAAHKAFARALGAAERSLPDGPARLPTLDRAALRVLAVHGWRRLVLRTPDLPDDWFPAQWCGPQSRARVLALLDRLGPVTADDLQDATTAV